jgi:hypothetical protein
MADVPVFDVRKETGKILKQRMITNYDVLSMERRA